MTEKRLPDVVVRRLSLYARELRRLEHESRIFVSSAALAESLNLSAAQVRRDLSSCGQFGTSGRGYDVYRLHASLRNILGLDDGAWPVALAGVGNLGLALLAYRGFRERGFDFRVAFDIDSAKAGRTVHGVRVERSERLVEIVRSEGIRIGVIAVPFEQAQRVCDAFVTAGVSAVLNFAPTPLTVPAHLQIRHEDLSLELEQLTYYVAQAGRGRQP